MPGGIEVVVETWDKKYGKGIDDVIRSGNEDKIRDLTEEEINELLRLGNAENPCNGDWVYVLEIERFINIKFGTEYKKSQFADRFGLQDPRFATALIGNGVKRVDKITYLPAQEVLFEENGQTYLNLWRNLFKTFRQS